MIRPGVASDRRTHAVEVAGVLLRFATIPFAWAQEFEA